MLIDYAHPHSTITAREFLACKLIEQTMSSQPPTLDGAIRLQTELQEKYGIKLSTNHLLNLWSNDGTLSAEGRR